MLYLNKGLNNPIFGKHHTNKTKLKRVLLKPLVLKVLIIATLCKVSIIQRKPEKIL